MTIQETLRTVRVEDAAGHPVFDTVLDTVLNDELDDELDDAEKQAADRQLLIASQLDKKPPAYIMCRFVGHSWQDPERQVLDVNTERWLFECMNCGGEAWWDITLRGRIVKRGRRMPKDYRMRKTGRLTTADNDTARATFIRRQLKGD